MRLKLKQISGAIQPSAARGDWQMEQGRRTIGRSDQCQWQIRDDRCSISKHHCTIERTLDGYFLRDESANGTTVDGRLYASGERTLLDNGSRIVLGNFAFDVEISGTQGQLVDDPDEDLQLVNDDMSVSSILSNVTATGAGGHGILGGTGQNNDLPAINPDKKRKSIPIGWEGPPTPDGIQSSVLPDDWNETSDLSTMMEHQDALRSHAPRIRTATPITEADTIIEPQQPIEIIAEEPKTTLADDLAYDAAIRRLTTVISTSESLLDGKLHWSIHDGYDNLEKDLTRIEQLDQLAERLSAHNARLEDLFVQAAVLFDPAQVEKRTNTRLRRLPRLAALTYWEAYCAQFGTDGAVPLGVRDLLLKAMDEHEGQANNRSRDIDTDISDEI